MTDVLISLDDLTVLVELANTTQVPLSDDDLDVLHRAETILLRAGLPS